MAAEFLHPPWPHGQRCLPIWLSLVLATVLSDTANSRSSPPPPAPLRFSTIDSPGHLLEPPLGHINQGLSGSRAAPENRKAGDTGDKGASKREFNTVSYDGNQLPIYCLQGGAGGRGPELG